MNKVRYLGLILLNAVSVMVEIPAQLEDPVIMRDTYLLAIGNRRETR